MTWKRVKIAEEFITNTNKTNMKKTQALIATIAFFMAALSVQLAVVAMLLSRLAREQEAIREMYIDTILCDTNKVDVELKDWHHFIDAVMYVESKNNTFAVGRDNDAGVLQITPIYVEEVNRILGERRYSLEDRFDKYKSIEMFTIMNNRYNPERCFYKAMRIHNPNAPETYRKKILEHYIKIKNQQ